MSSRTQFKRSSPNGRKAHSQKYQEMEDDDQKYVILADKNSDEDDDEYGEELNFSERRKNIRGWDEEGVENPKANYRIAGRGGRGRRGRFRREDQMNVDFQ